MNTLTYIYGNKIYINLTNECSNRCEFCIRNNNNGVNDYYLWLDKNPTAEEVIDDLKKYDFTKYSEAVFCGFGEPLYALDVLLKVAEYLKAINVKTRLNTNGQASLIIGDGVAERLKGKIDTVSISLNAGDAKRYNEICNCCFGEAGYESLLKFASDCLNEKMRVIFSVVDTIGKDEIENCRRIAEKIGVEYRVREYT